MISVITKFQRSLENLISVIAWNRKRVGRHDLWHSIARSEFAISWLQYDSKNLLKKLLNQGYFKVAVSFV